jgi:ubiquinone/menaquinone biosynthesis C-methylase UbiE
MANTEYQLVGNAAELYEQFSVPTGTGPAARGMLDRIELNASDRILDAACGTGIVARLIVESGSKIASIVGLDLNESMLEVARKLEPGSSFPITWQQGDLCALPFSDHEFDVVICNHGFQFVPKKALALTEIKRVLANDGRFVFTVWSAEAPINVAIANSIRTHIGEDLAKAVLAPFAYRDLPTIQKLLNDAGFQSIAIQELTITRRLPAIETVAMDVIKRSAYAGDVAAASDTARDAIAREVYEAMQPYKEGSEFAEPMSNHLVQVKKVK